MRERQWAASTINHYRSLLLLVYKLGIKAGKLTVNPASAVSHQREDNSRVRFLTPAEEARLRKVLAANYVEHIPELDLALNTGLRRTDMYERLDVGARQPRPATGDDPSKQEQKPHHVRLNKAAIAALRVFLAEVMARAASCATLTAKRWADTITGFGQLCGKRR